MVYPVVEVPEGSSTQLEQLGSKRKFWFQREDGGRYLFKQGRPNTGEDWAEKASCEIARSLGLPHAEYELASHLDQRGVVSPTFVPERGTLVHGNELLVAITPDSENTRRARRRQHTVQLAMQVTRSFELPIGWPQPDPRIINAADVFVGYVMLDALVSNQDRHDENWGFVAFRYAGATTLSPFRLTLAPTFDHASSLGRNESDEERTQRLHANDEGRTVEAYVARATSRFYGSRGAEEPRQLRTLEAFQEAAKMAPGAAAYWTERVAALTLVHVEHIFGEFPPDWASPVARDFALEVVRVNRQRLLATGPAQS